MVRVLMDTLQKHVLEGQAAEGGFKAVTWNACVKAITPYYRGEGHLSAKSCRNKFAVYKKVWRQWKTHLRAVSGWGSNEEGVPVNESDVEDNYFADHQDRSIFRDTLPPYYTQLKDIVGDAVATEAHAHGPDSDTDGGENMDEDLQSIGHESDSEDDVRSHRISSPGSSRSSMTASPAPSAPTTRVGSKGSLRCKAIERAQGGQQAINRKKMYSVEIDWRESVLRLID
jgi:hypothetical protein